MQAQPVRLKPSEVTIGFGPKVLKSFQNLRKALQGKPAFSGETLDLIDDVAKHRHGIPVAIAAIARIAAETSAYIQQTNDQTVHHLLSELTGALSGLGDYSVPINIEVAPKVRSR